MNFSFLHKIVIKAHKKAPRKIIPPPNAKRESFCKYYCCFASLTKGKDFPKNRNKNTKLRNSISSNIKGKYKYVTTSGINTALMHSMMHKETVIAVDIIIYGNA